MSTNNPFAWPFLMHRQGWIEKADKFWEIAYADECEASHFDGKKNLRLLRKSARYFERAAEYYRKAGLGMLSRDTWGEASDCWFILGEIDEANRCEEHVAEIDTYYEDEAEEGGYEDDQ